MTPLLAFGIAALMMCGAFLAASAERAISRQPPNGPEAVWCAIHSFALFAIAVMLQYV